MIRPCLGCGKDYNFQRTNQKRCKKDCGRTSAQSNHAKKLLSENHEIEFIAVDGEGITNRKGGHDYVLLSVGDRSLHRNGLRLTWQEIFPFLWDCFESNPRAAFVGFFLGYDFTQWLRGIRSNRAHLLLTKEGIRSRERKWGDNPVPFPVRVGDWEIDMLGDKRFKLRPYLRNPPKKIVTHKDGTQSEQNVIRPWMYICDAGPFFQTSFMNAIDPKSWSMPIVTEAEHKIIARGKETRSDAKFDPAMITYNLMENDVLARLMTILNDGFVTDGIRLKRQQWFGPGQAAQAWMSLIGTVPTAETVQEIVPPWAREAARDSYYGGWFEIFFHGLIPGTSYSYDINSAYPTIIAKLPCLLHGKWTRGIGTPKRMRNGVIRLVRALVQGNHRSTYGNDRLDCAHHVGAMPHRRPDGTILRPHKTRGWYYWHELQAAKRAECITRIDVEEWIEYEPCECAPPLGVIEALYQGRLTVGKNSPQGKARKLVYNSAYGKLAQSIGMPKFTNAIYASLITAGCRTMILDAIATHPRKQKDLLMVATDSVTFRSPHPNLPMSETELGKWDETEHENLSLLMPGMYWDDATRERVRAAEQGALRLKSRGISARDLSRWIFRIDKLWRQMWETGKWPEVAIPVSFAVISARQAIHRNDWRSAGTVLKDEPRKLDAIPDSKRSPQPWINEEHSDLIWTVPYQIASELDSTPYDRAFGDDFREHQVLEELQTPEGPLINVINAMMRP